MRNGSLCPVLVALFTLMMSCAGTRETTTVEPLPSDEILRRIQNRTTTIRTLEADGALTVESPEQSGTVRFDLFLKIPDTLWMKFSGPFGMSVGMLVLTPSRFIFYDPFQRQKITGAMRPEILARVLNVSLSFPDIVDVVTGNFHGIGLDETIVSNTVSGNRYYVLRINAGNQETNGYSRKEIWVDAETFVTTQYAEYDDEDHVRLIGQSSRIEAVDGVSMPHLIRVIMPQRRHSVTLAYSTLRINRPTRTMFSIPADVREMSIDEEQSE